MKLPKIYEAKEYEAAIYKLWEESGAFHPSEDGEPFSIVMPPPNATGRLHVGHAAMLAIEDTLIRYNRMNGKSALWTPGTDHAGIATNAVIEKQLTDEGKTKEDIGREAFLARLGEFVDESIDTIRSQVKAMGSSCDWSRERYTMEPAMNRIVSEVFVKMFNDGLIYRGKRIVNWDHVLQTVVSDDELEYKEMPTTLYTFKYGPFEISTARPETKFGDKYVVMHPDDERYAQYKHGEQFDAEWINGQVTATVIKDEAIDMEFGTGVMTITPWHDSTDFEIAQRHSLDMEPIIDLEGKLLPIAGEFSGMHIDTARPLIVEKLDAKGLLVEKDEHYKHRIALSDRGNAVIEPQVLEQWFIDVNKQAVNWHGEKLSLKEVMQKVVREGEIQILPKRFDKTYFHWIDNLRDWCISRQIWWGHQIPAWYRMVDGEKQIYVGLVPPEEDNPPAGGWKQDPDTLDTWFSSALWTWSTLISPEIALDKANSLEDMLAKSKDYQKYHPTTVLETGYDIIFFWVARMILMTTYVTQDVPFKTVYLHGLVRTKDGSKMSKSKPETIIDPLTMIDKYGTDALRLSLLVGQAPGNDMRIYEEKIAGYRNFCNKLWNIARFVEDRVSEPRLGSPKPESDADHWIIGRLASTASEVAAKLDDFQLGKAFDGLYHFIWDDLADWYLEVSKTTLNESVLVYALETALKLAHPFTPFVTETIWDTLDWEEGLLINSKWPKVGKPDLDKAAKFDELTGIVKEVRHLRAEVGAKNDILFHSGDAFVEQNAELIIKLAGIKEVQKEDKIDGYRLTQTSHTLWLQFDEVKATDYLEKLRKNLLAAEAAILNLEKRLSNDAYTSSAPSEVVAETRQQLDDSQEHLTRLKREIDAFNGASEQ